MPKTRETLSVDFEDADVSGNVILCQLCTDASATKTYTMARDSGCRHLKTKHLRDMAHLEADLHQINAPPPAPSAIASLSDMDIIMNSDSDSPPPAFPPPDVNLFHNNDSDDSDFMDENGQHMLFSAGSPLSSKTQNFRRQMEDELDSLEIDGQSSLGVFADSLLEIDIDADLDEDEGMDRMNAISATLGDYF
ncbi:hypothetical protein BT96DRAFT_934573 [Gymnopus androsaceus JB14]|uniref:Uncharacterized protein n=1 Tax=Gymnopus androsaceus JB14 TaxID=1447944 RepID=A0A6A4IAR9_9AGAR|nr:hypothetical protein BT96DRAFT_934573 [Gymnopus androsaceus JB14]